MLILDPNESRVIVEVTAAGILAAAAHDVRVLAGGASGESEDGVVLVARFPVNGLSVDQSRRHGRGEWRPPSDSDAKDIVSRIGSQVFAGGGEIVVEGRLEETRATLVVRAPKGEQRVVTTALVQRSGERRRVRGQCELSLRALGTGRVQVPLGAVKLEDVVHVQFDVAVRPA